MASTDPYCTNCEDQFSPIEGNRPSDEPGDQSNFCSDACYWQVERSIGHPSIFKKEATIADSNVFPVGKGR